MPLLTRLAIATWFALISTCAMAFQADHIIGRVVDPSGRPIAGAKVSVLAIPLSTQTDAYGHFSLGPIGSPHVLVRISAPGFANRDVVWRQADTPSEWKLSVSGTSQRVTVTGDAPTRALQVIPRLELQTSPAAQLDSTLRRIPGFELFRRTPSWAANPTTQGVSMRGTGASGASRSVVVLNGVPLNDPFGGWVYWGRVPPSTIDEVTVLQGGASELYGTQALGGALELTRLTPSETSASMEAYAGSLFTSGGSVLAGTRLGRWMPSVGVSLFRTEGYVPVLAEERGSIDTEANSRNASGWIRLDLDIASNGRAFLAADMYGESRQNGTLLQTNGATIRELQTGADWSSTRAGDWSVRLFGGSENLRQIFSAVAPDRATEALTRDQSVPTSQMGVLGWWSKRLSTRHMLAAGAEAGWIEGDSEELAFVAGTKTAFLRNGGTQKRAAAYIEDRIDLASRTVMTAGLRVDHWSNQDGHSRTTPSDPSVPTQNQLFANQSETSVSPHIGLSFEVSDGFTLRASASGAFRAPTLNELYRGFRVGNVVTTANSDLGAERQAGFEAGAIIAPGPKHYVRGTFFWSAIIDPVSNVTLAVTPTLITRQRQNLGRLRSTGMDFTWQVQWNDALTTSLAYQYANSIVTNFPADSTLVGNWVPQVARHDTTAQVRYVLPRRWTVAIEAHYQGRQYDDDRNLFPLGGYFLTSAFVSRELKHGVTVFLAGENLTNRRFEVGKTPVTTVGPPLTVRGGVRWIFQGR